MRRTKNWLNKKDDRRTKRDKKWRLKNLIEKETLTEIKINFSNNERRREEKKREARGRQRRDRKRKRAPWKKRLCDGCWWWWELRERRIESPSVKSWSFPYFGGFATGDGLGSVFFTTWFVKWRSRRRHRLWLWTGRWRVDFRLWLCQC